MNSITFERWLHGNGNGNGYERDPYCVWLTWIGYEYLHVSSHVKGGKRSVMMEIPPREHESVPSIDMPELWDCGLRADSDIQNNDIVVVPMVLLNGVLGERQRGVLREIDEMIPAVAVVVKNDLERGGRVLVNTPHRHSSINAPYYYRKLSVLLDQLWLCDEVMRRFRELKEDT